MMQMNGAMDMTVRKEMKKIEMCPRCNINYIPNNETPGLYPGALSRVDNKTEICSDCGVEEALDDYFGSKKG